ncbi:MAG TPA: DNA cytosine methyltransferase [Candidatus Saccharimonadales bacterium]|jgi:DNA (cytosine-5)-methyltransferase 1|nr:DNA cytosine methyltransferase [Candidatus Saccharimonadales bacterium]
MSKKQKKLTSIEVCAGAGGQALGLEMAGFEHVALVENDARCCETLRLNRPNWKVLEEDLNQFDGKPYKGVDLVAGGVPCPPFSKAGKQLGHLDERDLFPAALRLVEETKPKAVLLENVRGLLDPKFTEYRQQILDSLEELGYKGEWKLIQAASHGVPQLRPRAILVALQPQYFDYFVWPEVDMQQTTVGEALYEAMASNGWEAVDEWKVKANKVAPTLVGGSKKHGGADLGPTRAKEAWLKLGVDGKGIADEAPAKDFVGAPRLTVEMTATLQGFPKEWKIAGRKTSAYKQVGNAFPPPVAAAVGQAIQQAITMVQPAIVSATSSDDEDDTQVPIFASSTAPAA